ncbi:MAG: hypothetical protein ACYDH6_09260 [Acidimicrobiales bacterium]
MRSETLTFTTIVRTVAGEARKMGLVVPVFRSPPRLAGCDRTICRRHGDLIVAIRLRDRPFGDVAADVIQAILVCNPLRRGQEMRVRRLLLQAVEEELCADPRRYPGRVEVRVA